MSLVPKRPNRRVRGIGAALVAVAVAAVPFGDSRAQSKPEFHDGCFENPGRASGHGNAGVSVTLPFWS